MSNTAITYTVAAFAGVFGLLAFCMLILLPGVGAYRGVRERIAAGFLSLYVLGALVGIGVLLGGVVIIEWPRLF